MAFERVTMPKAAALVASVLIFASVEAQAAPRTQVVKSESAAKIVYYDSLCDEDNQVECLIAEIGCDAPGDFTATLFDLASKDAAAVFAKGNGKGSLAIGPSSWVLQLSRIALSEHTFTFDATLTSLEKGREIWQALWSAESLQFQAGTKKATLRRSDAGEQEFRDVVGVCAAAAQ